MSGAAGLGVGGMDLTHAAAALTVQVFSVRTPGLHLYVGLRAEMGNSHLTHSRFAWGGGWEVATSLWHLAGPQYPFLSSRPRGGEVGTGWKVLQRLRETGGRLIEVRAGTGIDRVALDRPGSIPPTPDRAASTPLPTLCVLVIHSYSRFLPSLRPLFLLCPLHKTCPSSPPRTLIHPLEPRLRCTLLPELT